MNEIEYTEENIQSLDWISHIRMRPGMYIGKLGNGSSQDDGIYLLTKEIIDNSIDEYVMQSGDKIEINLRDNGIEIRDYGRGVPLGKLVEVVSKMNTGGKYDTKAFIKSVGLNGVGAKAVNALSNKFFIQSVRNNKTAIAEFKKGELVNQMYEECSSLKNGTTVFFSPDPEIFGDYKFRNEFLIKMIKNYVYLNSGLTIIFNEEEYFSKDGLKDLLQENFDKDTLAYPIIHLKGYDIEVAMTHSINQYHEEYLSFVNGQYTTQGGTHQSAFKEAIVKTIRDFFGKNFDPSYVRRSIVSAISIKVMSPIFESQTKTKLGSLEMGENLPTVRTYINDFIKTHLDDFLHKNPSTTEAIQLKILQAEKEHKELSGIRKIARERAKKVNLHNKRLRDCKIHLQDVKREGHLQSSIFITEGDSASGSITKSRNVSTQAVFSLKGKPLNCYGLNKKIVYENEEFNLLQAALNIEAGVDNLRYNNIIIATDADVDGMHIRLLLITFFLKFFPEVIKEGHMYILETPLFRVRNKKETIYCYSEQEKQSALKKLNDKIEITRFKGLGEISPDEFSHFIGKKIRLTPVILNKEISMEKLLEFYMGKNTPDRQQFIIDNLKVELDLV